MMLSSILLAVAWPQATIPDPATPHRGQSELDVLNYQIELALAPPATSIQGVCTIEFQVCEPTRKVSFDLNSSLKITEVWFNSIQQKFLHKNDKVSVSFSKPLVSDNHYKVKIRYGGNLPQEAYSQGDAIGLLGDGVCLISYPEPDGAHNWFPCNDHPSDKASYVVAVSTPTGNIAAATGLIKNWSMFGAWQRWEWETKLPVATYLLSLGVGPYFPIVRAGEIPILDLALPGDEKKVKRNLAITPEMIPFLEDKFGPYPFEKYGHVFTHRWAGGLECQTQTILGRMSGLGGNPGLLIHELGHQWFGDWVSPLQWKDLWLNEGGATYCEWLWESHQNPAKAKQLLRSWRRSTIKLARQPKSYSLANPDLEELFDPDLVYNKGGIVLYLLEQYLGTKLFHQAIKHYFESKGGGCANTAMFEELLSEHSKVDLEQFFKQWVYGTKIPQISANMKVRRSKSKWKCTITIKQDKNNWFPLRAPIRLSDANGREQQTELVKIDSAISKVEFLLNFKPDTLRIDPEAILPIVAVYK